MKRLISIAMLFATPAMADPYGIYRPSDYELFKEDVRIAQKHARKPNTPTNGVPGYAFNLITIKHNSGRFGQILYEPFGVFASMQECDVARATKIAELGGARLLHQDPNAPETTTHFNDGSSATQQVPMKERMDVTFCEPGDYSPSLNPRIVPYTPAPKNLPTPGRRAAR
jgi:hypothetical protein